MNKIMRHLNLVSSTTLITMPFFDGIGHDELVRFVYVSIQKISKISLAFLKLYEQVDESVDLEFSLGILSRSIMMDMILTMGVQKITLKYNGNNCDEIKEELKKYCLKVIADGTTNLIEQIHESDTLSDKEKSEVSIRLASNFKNVFDFSFNKPKRKKEFKLIQREIYEESKVLNIEMNTTIYQLYDYYSKYDHLSHWTSLFEHIPFAHRKGKLDLSILLMGLHLQKLLALAYDFADGYKGLLPHIEYLGKHMKENSAEEDV